MNRKTKKRRNERRKAHQDQARQDRPALILDRDTFTEVKRAHIVPKTYQRAWALNGKVTVHVVGEQGDETVVQMPITHAGTRNRFYRRDRPDGTHIDDTEASLAHVERLATPVLRDALETTTALSTDDKGGLAQFIGVQMVRGPRFFDQRAELLEPLIREARQDQFKPEAIRAAGGNLDLARERLLDAYTAATQAHLTMLTVATKLGMVVGNMRWELLRFDGPVLVYSDHPVFVWPGVDELARPQQRQALGPLEAAEVLFPIGPQTLLVANWIDLPDPDPFNCEIDVASQANALIAAQADRQWMHQLDTVPPMSNGPFRTITSTRTAAYDADQVRSSYRRSFAAEELARNSGRQHLKQIRVLDLGVGAG